MNPIIRDLLKLITLGLSAGVVFELATNFNVGANQIFTLGMCMGVIVCFVLNALSSLIMNMGVIIKLTTCNAEDFGKFLKAMGCKANFIPIENEECDKEDITGGKNV